MQQVRSLDTRALITKIKLDSALSAAFGDHSDASSSCLTKSSDGRRPSRRLLETVNSGKLAEGQPSRYLAASNCQCQLQSIGALEADVVQRQPNC